MSNDDQFLGAIGRATIMAGPLFLGLYLMLAYQDSAPTPLTVQSGDLIVFVPAAIGLVLLSIVVGAVLAFPVCLVAGGMMFFLADHVPLARPTALWLIAGGGLALATSHALFDSIDDVGTLAFAGTAAACAALIRSRFHWD